MKNSLSLVQGLGVGTGHLPCVGVDESGIGVGGSGVGIVRVGV